MLAEKTVLVLGAGASYAECKMPMGWELYKKIETLCNERDRDLLQAIQDVGTPFQDVRRKLSNAAASRMAQNLAHTIQNAYSASSIDELLQHNDELREAGKAAIAYVLLQEEGPHKFKQPPPPDKPDERWYSILFDRMKADSFDEFLQNPLTVVTYNYDRTLENYLTHNAKFHYNRHKLPSDAAFQILSRIPIIHVHGHFGEELEFKFRDRITDEFNDDVYHAALRIKTIHEVDDKVDSPEYTKARAALREAQRVVVLGFGYHKQNTRRLHLDECCAGTINSTGYKMDQVARDNAQKIVGPKPIIDFAGEEETIRKYLGRVNCLPTK
jgi:hypothetical protein